MKKRYLKEDNNSRSANPGGVRFVDFPHLKLISQRGFRIRAQAGLISDVPFIPTRECDSWPFLQWRPQAQRGWSRQLVRNDRLPCVAALVTYYVTNTPGPCLGFNPPCAW